MKNTVVFSMSLVAVSGFIIICSGALGGLAGYKIGKHIRSRAVTALVTLLFCALTVFVFRTHQTPGQLLQRKVDIAKAKFYDTDGYARVTGATLSLRKAGAGWDLAVKIDGRRSGRYKLYCIMAQYYTVPGRSPGGSMQLFYKTVDMDLTGGPYETTVAIPSGAVAAKFSELSRTFDKGTLGPAKLEVYLEAVLPQNSEYYGPQWQLMDRLKLDMNIKDIGLALH